MSRTKRIVVGTAIAVAIGVAWYALRRESTSEIPRAADPSSQSATIGSATHVATASLLDGGLGPVDDDARPVGQHPDAQPGAATATGSGSAAPFSDDLYKNGALVTARSLRELPKLIANLVRECYDIARAHRPDIRGRLRLTVVLVTDPGTGNLVASADLDETATTIKDRGFLECATENVFAAEEVLDRLRADGDPTGGNMRFVIDSMYPPDPKPKKSKWPGDDESPTCAKGTVLKGDKPPRGTRQWCERADGTKHGDEYVWSGAELAFILIYDNGHSDKIRMRPTED